MMEKSTVPYDAMSTTSVSSHPMFSRCCCCIPLRIGCLILGYLSLIVNICRTLFLVIITLYVGLRATEQIPSSSIYDDGQPKDPNPIFDTLDKMDKSSLQVVEGIMILAVIIDLIWLGVNIACLVGLHKKRLGPIRVYIGFATFRFILTLVTYVHQLNSPDTQVIVARCLDLGLTAYFILVYYIYALRLEKEILASRQTPVVQVNEAPYIYPTKLDKEHLVV